MTTDSSNTEPMENEQIEFYVPATFQFSTEPGVIKRILVGIFHDRQDLEARIVTEEPTREFYTPAMYRFSTDKGRIERFLNTVFQERGEQEFKTVPESFVDMFYLPASNMDVFRRRDEEKRRPVTPASEVVPDDRRTT